MACFFPPCTSGSQCKIETLEFWTGEAAGGRRLFLSSLLSFSKGPFFCVGKCSYFLMRVKPSCLWPLQCGLTRSWWELLCGSLWHGWKALQGTDWSHLPSVNERVDTLKRKSVIIRTPEATIGRVIPEEMNVCFCVCKHLFAGWWKAKWTGPQSRSLLCDRGPQPQNAPGPNQEPASGSSVYSPSEGWSLQRAHKSCKYMPW